MFHFTQTSQQRIFRAAIAGGVLFAVLTTVAMVVYPGGTRNDPTPDGYLFGQNFFSDLGRTVDFEGNSNTLSMLLFGSGLTIVGCTTAVFFLALTNLFGADRIARATSLVMCGFGLLAGVGFIGIAFTPWDLYFTQHDFCVNVGFRSLLLACIAAMINVYRTRTFANVYGHVLAFVSLILLSYILLLAFGPSAATPRGLTIQVGGQKVVAYVLVAGITLLAVGATRVSRKPDETDPA